MRLTFLLIQPGFVIVSPNLSLHVRLNISLQSPLVLTRSVSHCTVIGVKVRAKSRLGAFDSPHWLWSEPLSRLMKLLHLQLLANSLIDMSCSSSLLQFLKFLDVPHFLPQFHSIGCSQLTGIFLLKFVDSRGLDTLRRCQV